ncbi:phosphatidylinositol phosphatase PTPRQ-like [Stylophora pistillata]|uniref:phosphatidylinositol phosphatase PTPRQ-like n=1 Tax=Stylophora pistillata TaxID=50429 RepID=UPI000C046963|nr:phosphatidylinositol phosphatase PTPRQ-like [Stylophora pistillata]
MLIQGNLVTVGNICTCLFIFKAPSAAPGNFRVTSNSSLALDITWDAIPAEKQNGKLLGYRIYYKVNGSTVEYNKTVGPDKLVYQLTGLEFTTYVVRMAGYTAVGVGLSTGSVGKQPKGGVLGYAVLYKEKGQQNSFRLNTTSTDTIIRRLKPYTEYCIQVQGFTKAGESPFSPCFDVRTLDKGPSQPLNVQVQAVSSVAILVKWDAPAHPNGEIKEYIIFYGTRKDVQKNERKVTGNTRERTIDGLRKYTTYYVKVRGSTSKPGNASEIFSVTTFEDIPSQPQDVFAKLDKCGTFITVSWKDPKDHNGIIIMYTVYFEGKRAYDPSFTDNHQIVLRNSSRSTEIGVEKLWPGTEYSIYVKASTVKGYGAESGRVEQKTLSQRMRTFFVHLCEYVGT